MPIKRVDRPHTPQAAPRSEYTVLVDIPKGINKGLHSISGIQVEKILGPPPKQMKEMDAGPFCVKETELALIDFQRKHGLIPNGVLGPKTLSCLASF